MCWSSPTRSPESSNATGKRLQGAASINRVLDELGGGWRVLAVPYRWRPLAAAEEAFYRWFASNRSRFHRFGVTPECE
ncbi:MAG: DUF393 domain-containing protein [Chloroflexi bacterium]|nr:MAG: DUF393 domain-containing protein [Chloroflexota bacterium]